MLNRDAGEATVFARLGTTPIINACGIYTDLGGSRLSPGVLRAMQEINGSFVRMADLLESSGAALAAHLGAEAGRVTPGAAASIALMVSAAMTGADRAASERLPDTSGLRNEILLQHNHRYKYARQIPMTGARLVLAGDDTGTGEEDVERLIGPATAALFLPAHLDGRGRTVPLGAFARIASRHGVPLLVDAAYLCWPLELMPGFTRGGADLVCFSAKYFGGPNAGGFVVGSRRMIDALSANDFLRYESGAHRAFGRPFKLDRQTVAAVVVAFEEWLATDHAARWAGYARLVQRMAESIGSPPGVRVEGRYFTMDERLDPEPVNALVLSFDPQREQGATQVAAALAAESPSVACIEEPDRLVFCVEVLTEDEADLLARILARALC